MELRVCTSVLFILGGAKYVPIEKIAWPIENDMLEISLDSLGSREPIKIFIHEHYKKFLTVLLNEPKIISVTGNTGTGKTCFGVYVAHTLVTRYSKKVIYERGKDQFILCEGEESEVERIIFDLTTSTGYPLNVRSS